ncbi:Metallo-peptidase family M12-domain-containing protein [Gautieria morchelliformis]|nr:Metallo-peptidase family M12-domain-containing protein [Gautieria morchelliformis]
MSFSFRSFMRIPVAIVALAWICITLVEASSPPPRPLKRLAQPSIHTLEILPRSPSLQQRSHLPSSSPAVPPDSPLLQHSDSFRLTLSAFEQTFHLHLHPNPHIFHSSARINYYTNGPHGKAVLVRTEPLLRGNVKAYWGDVIHPDVSHRRMREDTAGGLVNSDAQPLGWARILVHDQGDVDAGLPPTFEGAFSINGDVHHVVTNDNYMRTKHPLDPHLLSHSEDPSSSLVVFRDSDIMSHGEEAQFRESGIQSSSSDNRWDTVPTSDHPSVCSHDRLDWNSDPGLNPVLRRPKPPTWFETLGFRDGEPAIPDNASAWYKRDDVAGATGNQNFADQIGQSAGCPTQQKIVYSGVAADCKYVQQYGSTQNATTAILNDWNMASGLYKSTFNVSLGIVQIDMHDPTCPSPPDTTRPWNVDCNTTLNDRLSLFSKWRGDKGPDGAGLWHLMSGCPTGTEVGVAWLSTLCQETATGSPGNFVSSTAVTTAGRSEWQVVAHETGHNFGAIHDCVSGCNSTSPCCPLTTSTCDSGGSFIMSPTTSLAEAKFSSCTLGNICSLMLNKSTNTTCVQTPDPNKQTLALQMCGNGIVETGEECDPGQGTNSTCCNPTTCKFTAGSVCDPAGSACCTQQCQFAPSTQVCRPALNPTCDIAETCNGTSATCPWDRTQPNGKSCGSNGLACASGQCTSESQQCQTIGASMGLTTACHNKGDTSCQVSCQDPQNSGQCMVLQAQLVDGSPCGYGGSCSGGKCKAGSILDVIKAWYLANLQIAIPVTVIAGIVVLFIIYGIIRCIMSCCRRDRRRTLSAEPALKAVPVQRLNSWTGVGPPRGVPPRAPAWVPQSAQHMRNLPRSGERDGVPAVLRAGPTAAQRSQRSRGAPDSRYPRMPTGSAADGSSRWVDPTAWNGPPR